MAPRYSQICGVHLPCGVLPRWKDLLEMLHTLVWRMSDGLGCFPLSPEYLLSACFHTHRQPIQPSSSANAFYTLGTHSTAHSCASSGENTEKALEKQWFELSTRPACRRAKIYSCSYWAQKRRTASQQLYYIYLSIMLKLIFSTTLSITEW